MNLTDEQWVLLELLLPKAIVRRATRGVAPRSVRRSKRIDFKCCQATTLRDSTTSSSRVCWVRSIEHRLALSSLYASKEA